ncbi:hypothetical protein Tco_1557544, partial [Tanacetum coccineum]
TDISKITRKPSKTGKHGYKEQENTKEAKDSKSKPKKVNPGQISGQISHLSASLAHLAKESHEDVGKHTRMMDFALKALIKQAQAVTSRNDSLAIRGKKIMIQGL